MKTFVEFITEGASPLNKLIEAIKKDDERMVLNIVDKNEDVVNMLTKEGATPLMFATARNEKSNIMKILIEAGADIERKSKNSVTALMIAVLYGNQKNVDMLVKAGAKKVGTYTNGDSIKDVAKLTNIRL